MTASDPGAMPSGRRYSTNPTAIRSRIRRNGNRVAQDLVMLHEAQYGDYKPVSEWTWEELQHGRPRHPTAGWRGPRPKWITPVIQAEIARRLREESIAEIVMYAGAAVKVLAEFLTNSDEPNLRFKAAQLILEYAAGRPEVNMVVQGNVKLEGILAEALVLDDGSDAHPVIDGAIVEIDDDSEEADG
jgi:hypothetical protein